MSIIQVSHEDDSSYSTIQAAIHAAQAGDTIEVASGMYRESIRIDKPLVVRRAVGEDDSVWITDGIQIATAGDVRLESIILGDGDSGLHVHSGHVTLQQCLFSLIQGVAMVVDDSAKVSAKDTSFRKNVKGIVVAGRLALMDCVVEESVENAQITVSDGGEIALTDCGILSGQEEGIHLTNGSRASITKCSLIGNRGAQISVHEGSFLDAESTNVYVGKSQGVSSHQSKGVLKNCSFTSQEMTHIELLNGTRFEIESCQFENGDAEGVMVHGSSVTFSDSLFKAQKGDHLTCSEQSDVTIQKSQVLSGRARGIVCGNSTCTVSDSEVKYNQMTQLSAFNESVLTVSDCEIEKGKNKGIYATDSQVKVSDSVVSHHSSLQIFASEHSELTLSATEVKSGESVGVSAKESQLNVFNCLISGHKGSNVVVSSDAKANLTDCRISSGEKNGILVGEGAAVSVERTVLFHHKRPQVSATDAAEVVLADCEIYDGSSSGLSLTQVAKVHVTSCKVHRHRDDQMVLQDCSGAIFTDTHVMDGTKAGMRLERSVPVLENCLFDENRGGGLVRLDDSEPVLKNTELAIPPVSSGERDGTGKDSLQTDTAFSNQSERMNIFMRELNGFIGLEDVKDKIRDITNLVEINQFKIERGMKTVKMAAPHLVFQGNPGTGKTTIARLIGGIFKELGLLKQGHVVEVKREDLVGTHVGESEERTKVIIQEAMGGVLFIDEAYSLVVPGASSKDYGKKVIDTLLPAMENARGKFVVIAAGYPEDMDRFLTSNPGLKDRFTETITFQDYTPDELLQIFLAKCDGSYVVTSGAKKAVHDELVERYRTRDATFGNARMTRTLYDQIALAQSMRLAKLPREEWTDRVLTTFEEQDVLQAVQKQEMKTYEVPIDEDLLAQKRAELHRFIGLGSVKAEIDEMIELMRYYRRENYSTDKLMNHTLLIGKPGTGKTEVGRVLAGIYQALGLLERGELIEVDRSDLVGSHIGETEKLTAQQIERAMGSALFIDEAYTLAGGGDNDFGQKAVEVLLKQMSDRQGEFLLIAAGYEHEMNRFLDSNAGLRRRFGLTLHFEDYTPEELMAITELSSVGYGMTDEAKCALLQHYQDLYARRDDYFGNAGLAKKMAKEMTRKVDYRLAVASNKQTGEELTKEITKADVVLLES